MGIVAMCIKQLIYSNILSSTKMHGCLRVMKCQSTVYTGRCVEHWLFDIVAGCGTYIFMEDGWGCMRTVVCGSGVMVVDSRAKAFQCGIFGT